MNIWWIRRDLRLADNPALTAALQANAPLLPVFILDDHLIEKACRKTAGFFVRGIASPG